MNRKKVLVLGVGNILFTDEGIGVHAIRYLLRHVTFPDTVRLLDGGTLGLGLMDAIMDCDLLVVLDAVLGDQAPGSLYRLEGDDLRKSLSFRDSMHQTDLVDTLLYCELAGHRPAAVILGMEPQDFQSMGLELTPPCAAALPELAQRLVAELTSQGLHVDVHRPFQGQTEKDRN